MTIGDGYLDDKFESIDPCLDFCVYVFFHGSYEKKTRSVELTSIVCSDNIIMYARWSVI